MTGKKTYLDNLKKRRRLVELFRMNRNRYESNSRDTLEDVSNKLALEIPKARDGGVLIYKKR
jgi:hypothetical protein